MPKKNNSFLTNQNGLKPTEVKLTTINYSEWKLKFTAEKETIVNILKEIKFEKGKDGDKKEIVVGERVKVIHVGSTAVNKILSKPIIDILVGFKTVKELNKALAYLISKDGYKLVYTMKRNGFVMIIKENDGVTVAHYHFTLVGSDRWGNLIGFRNVLRQSRTIKAGYSALKESIAGQDDIDRKNYTRQKYNFIQAIQFRIEMDRI
jgi:GrpB-like predicted nucleotidyltransferase (UPF0157 family)